MRAKEWRGHRDADRDYMAVVPGRVAKVNEGHDGDEEVDGELEDFEVRSSHGVTSANMGVI